MAILLNLLYDVILVACDPRVRKVLRLRIFDDDNDKRWCKSVMDKQLDVLCVSQVGVNKDLSYSLAGAAVEPRHGTHLCFKKYLYNF